MSEILGTLALITGFAGMFLVVVAVITQIPEYRGVPIPTWEIRKSVTVAIVGILLFLLAIIMARAGI